MVEFKSRETHYYYCSIYFLKQNQNKADIQANEIHLIKNSYFFV